MAKLVQQAVEEAEALLGEGGRDVEEEWAEEELLQEEQELVEQRAVHAASRSSLSSSSSSSYSSGSGGGGAAGAWGGVQQDWQGGVEAAGPIFRVASGQEQASFSGTFHAYSAAEDLAHASSTSSFEDEGASSQQDGGSRRRAKKVGQCGPWTQQTACKGQCGWCCKFGCGSCTQIAYMAPTVRMIDLSASQLAPHAGVGVWRV